jgi:hypothetical protein
VTNEELLTKLMKLQLATNEILHDVAALSRANDYQDPHLTKAHRALQDTANHIISANQSIGSWLKYSGGIPQPNTSEPLGGL